MIDSIQNMNKPVDYAQNTQINKPQVTQTETAKTQPQQSQATQTAKPQLKQATDSITKQTDDAKITTSKDGDTLKLNENLVTVKKQEEAPVAENPGAASKSQMTAEQVVAETMSGKSEDKSFAAGDDASETPYDFTTAAIGSGLMAPSAAETAQPETDKAMAATENAAQIQTNEPAADLAAAQTVETTEETADSTQSDDLSGKTARQIKQMYEQGQISETKYDTEMQSREAIGSAEQPKTDFSTTGTGEEEEIVPKESFEFVAAGAGGVMGVK